MRTPSGARRRATLGWGLLVLAIVGAGAGVHAEGPPTRHVLFLNSYRHGVEWSDDLRPLDAIVAADDEALTFLLEHRDELFPGVPVVFMRINNADLFARADPKSYTGLREELRTGDIVDLATTLRPATRRIIVVGDATSTASAQLDAYRAAAERRPGLSFVFLDGGRTSLDQSKPFTPETLAAKVRDVLDA